MEEIKKHFEAEAQDFDRIILALIPDYRQMLEALIAGLPFDKAKTIRVVDLGCGTGTVARAIADAFPNASLTCIDIAHNMLDIARIKLGRHVRVEFALSDFEKFEFNGEYDAIVSSLALHHLRTDADKKRFYGLIYQHLGRGGVFYNADVVLGSNDFLQFAYLKKWNDFMRRSISQDEIDQNWMPKYKSEDCPARLMEQLVWMKEIGFCDLDVIWKYYNFAVYGGAKQL